MKLVTAAQLAIAANCTSSNIRRACRSGELRAILAGKTWLIAERDAARYVPRPKGRPRKIIPDKA